MLFARFLEENNLLIAVEWGEISVSLKDCEELGKDEGLDKWAMAARFAHQMLPQVFRPEHPAFEVRFAREHRRKLEGLVEGLPTDIFIASDSLGWVYQFWQSKKKDEVKPLGGQDRGGRIAGGNAALHRGLHGGISSRQHVGRLVGRRVA